jgi:hypothetical protein
LTGTSRGRLDEFARRGWRFDLGERKAEIIRNLGRPVRIDTQAVANRHRPEVEDTTYTLVYDGLEVCIYDATQAAKEILTRLTLTDPRYPTRWDLGVGASAERVVRVLGEPGRRSEDKLIYEAGEPVPDQLTFFLEGGSVKKVEWHFYID